MNLRKVDRSYTTAAEVERAIGFAGGVTNVTAAQILTAIIVASDEVDLITHTTYHSVEDSGTATSGAVTTLTDTNQSWTANQYADFVVWIYGGTGSGQYSVISSNTTDTLTFATVSTAPDSTSTYRILPDCIITKSLDGDNSPEFHLPWYPIKNLQSLSITGTTVTPSKVYVYEDEGYLLLDSQLAPEVLFFSATYPQSIAVSWVYGVYPVPRDINKLTANMAAIQCLIEQIGGTYNDITSYSIPHYTASKGEPYTNIREALTRLEKETNKLLTRVVKFPQTV